MNDLPMKINHVGYVVRDMEKYALSFPEMTRLHYVHDPLQHAMLGLYSPGDGSCLIELIQPEGSDAFTWGHLQRNGEGLHHICYEGLSMQDVEKLILDRRMIRVRGPMYAPLFERDVIFAVTRQRAIVEFLL